VGPGSDVLFVASFAFLVPGAGVIGALLGWWLGGRVADLRYRPASAGVAPPRIGKEWVFAGAVVGWLVGIAIGMGLTMVVMPLARANWLLPILFLSPPVVLLVLGGFVCPSFARWRESQRMNK
jgi:hypothetical protein